MVDKIQVAAQYVLFRLGNEEYAFDIATVKEIHELQHVAKVHRTPSYIEGVMNLRGKLVTVVDLRKRLGIEAAPIGEASKIIVVEAPDAPVGFLVDEVTEVAKFAAETVEPPPSALAEGVESEYVLAIAKLGERLVTIIDPVKILQLSTEEQDSGGKKHG
jgi:purine-binding chemotaxis protein CheW